MAKKKIEEQPVERRKSMEEFNVLLEQIRDGQQQLLLRMEAFENKQDSYCKLTDKMEKALYPNGNPGALQEIEKLKMKMNILTLVGSGLWSLFVIIFGIAMTKMFELLAILAEKALLAG